MNRRHALIAAIVVAALAVVAAGWAFFGHRRGPATSPVAAQPASDGSAVTGPARAKGAIAMTDGQMQRLGIVLAEAKTVGSVPLAELPAIIVPPANARVAVAATFAGVVTRVFAVEGQSVRKGDPLAIVASRDVLILGSDLSRANARLGVARSSAGRLGQLAREGVIAGARADEAAATLTQAQVDVSEKRRILALSNASGTGGSYTLSAPIAGRVTTATAQAGSPVDGTTAPFVIDASDRFAIEAQLPERLVGIIKIGMQVRLGRDAVGTVTAIGATIDPMTRSVMLKASIPAAPGIVTGKATTVTIYGAPKAAAVSVPMSAVTEVDGAETVFVRGERGFAARRISVAGTVDGLAVVTTGLRAGERVVTTGTTELKSLVAGQ